MVGFRQVEIAGRKLMIYENEDTNDPTTGRTLTGSWLWDSALFLAEFLSTHELTNQVILELGAGTGLPGMAAAVLGAARVILTDVCALLPGLRVNVEANGLMGRVEVRELEWGSEVDASEFGEVDSVVMSDVLYDVEGMEGLGKVLKEVCGEKTKVWVATEVRMSSGECLEALVAQGFRVAEVEVRTRVLMRSPEETGLFAVYEISPPASDPEE